VTDREYARLLTRKESIGYYVIMSGDDRKMGDLMPSVEYRPSSEAWATYGETLKRLILTDSLKRVCEVGGGANPALSIDFISGNGVDYTILDISEPELQKAPAGYKTIVGDICNSTLAVTDRFDLVFSQMLAEHVSDAELFHRNVRSLLVDGGFACHFFPTLYAAPFVLNRLVPEAIASWILDLAAPRDRHRHDKFPAFYRWCRGPTRRQIKRLEDLRFAVLRYTGFFGHGYYYQKLPPIRVVHEWLTQILLRHPSPYLTSFAVVLLRREPDPPRS